jgi:peptidyl-prolyl cis-trans isomerase B (cyclophilin B)
MKNPAALPFIEGAISAEPFNKEHPDQQIFVIQAAQALGNIGAGDGEEMLLPLLQFPGSIADNAIIALAKILRGNPERFFQLAQGYRSDGQISGYAWAQAMAEMGGADATKELYLMLERAATSSAVSERQILPDILSALAEVDARVPQEIWQLLLRSRDCAVLPAAIAAYLPQPGIKAPWTPIIEAFTACSTSSNARARTEILSYLKPWIREKEVQQLLWTGLGDSERTVRLVSGTLLRRSGLTGIADEPVPGTGTVTDATGHAIAATRKNSTIAQVETTRGALEIELFREDAPITVQSFVLMAKRGGYDGMELARVLPFRIEGKIPRSRLIPRRMINGEINMRPFERGSIGMAIIGGNSDIGGFFIALAPQPRSDGVHTCFGRVVSGMQVADRIVPGDHILRILIKETISFHDYQKY